MATKKPIYVDELFGTIATTDENEEIKWYVVRTKPQREKKLAQWAKDNEIEYYLPQYTSTRIYKYRKIEFTKPLFPGYLFVKMNKKQQEILYRPGHLVTFVKVKNERELVAELQQIYIVSKFGINMQPVEDYSILERGTKVRVTKGSLQGLIGFVIESENSDKVLISVNIIRQAVEVTLDRGSFEVVKED